MGLLRRLLFNIATVIYSIIPSLYDIFYKISSSEIFDREVIENFSRNIYIIVSACMLFALGIRLLTAIVNPDSFNDNKKGAKRTFLNCLIAVVLIAIIPTGFRLATDIQNNLIGSEDGDDANSGNNLIAVLFLGTDVGNNDTIGEILAMKSFEAFCYLNDEEHRTDDTVNAFNELSEDYSEGKLEAIGEYISEKMNGEYEIQFHMILSPLFGGYMVYQLILLCLDVATRAIRLAILEIMAPLVICAFIFSGTEILQKWFKDVISTYIIVFAKLVGIIFIIFGANQISNLMENVNSNFSGLNAISRGFVKAAYFIALFTVVNQLPSIINNIFGTNIKEQGGIRGRLGNMAGIGAMAQNAWDSLRHHPLQSASRVLSAPVAALGGLGAHIGATVRRGNQRADEIRRRMQEDGTTHTDDEIERAAGRARALSILSGTPGALGAAFRSGRAGFRNGNIQSIGQQYQRYLDRHPAESDFGQRLRDSWRLATGRRTTYEQQLEDDNSIKVSDKWKNPVTGVEEERERTMSFEQLQREQTQFNEARGIRDRIVEAASKALERGDSGIRLNLSSYNESKDASENAIIQKLGEGTYSQLIEKYNKFKASGVDDSGNTLSSDDLATMHDALSRLRESAIHTISTAALSNDKSFSQIHNVDGDFNSVSINGSINNGQFDDIYNSLRIDLNSRLAAMDSGYTDNITIVNNWDDLDKFNLAAIKHQHFVNQSVTDHNEAIANRVNTGQGRNLKASSEAAHNRQNNNSGNSGGVNNGGNH